MPRTLCAALAAMLPLLAEAAQPQRFHFDVLLDGKRIGTHHFDLSAGADGELQVQSRASFRVTFLGIGVYSYRHTADEQWRAGCLARIDASTQDNGKTLQVRGAADAGVLRLTHPLAASRERCVSSYAYWDAATLLRQTELLNPQTGEFEAVRFESMGKQTITSRGAPVVANAWRLRAGKLAIDLWYSESGQWLQLESAARGDRRLRYQLRD